MYTISKIFKFKNGQLKLKYVYIIGPWSSRSLFAKYQDEWGVKASVDKYREYKLYGIL